MIVLLLWALSVVVDGSQYRFDYSYHEGTGGWFKVHKIPATWNDARVRCDLEGAVLASPINTNVTIAMVGLMNRAGLDLACGVYTGTSAHYSKGDYFSIEGIPLSRMSVGWMATEPDNYKNGESCIVLDPTGSIADVQCSQVLPYVCYKKAGSFVPLNECGTSDNEYKLYKTTGNCYKFHTQARPWAKAFEACSAEGGYLAIPNDKDEAMHLKDLFKQNLDRAAITTKFKSVMFLGFSDIDKDGVWTTVHGTRLEDVYFNWKKGQPEGKRGSSPCGAMYQDGELDDYFCENPAPFVCEKAVDSLL
ncbi:C-type mannose receptor 2-like [Aricia agestis]|uniref:C-type mannose receptor 2-like n=1 Tax=Aricia agestis TaxID=91739 RepID=UPI001C20C05A|nr:C-type mannose receptor 2-like [Aricia agestis]XP_041984489.1 C-type mannose receptor 2-like [Aricia agestis]